MYSCIYEGTVAHRRVQPVTHQFRYRLFMVYLDLVEIPALTSPGGLIPRSRYCRRSFLRSDHLFDATRSLEREVRDIIREQTGESATGPIRLLTQLRHFNLYFSPLNLFYVFDEAGERVCYVVAEVNNTPWGERHCYVLWTGNKTADAQSLCYSHPKRFHVSPFMGMAMNYSWQLQTPGEHLKVRVASSEGLNHLFEAGMSLERIELTSQNLRRMTVRYPFMTAKISAAIYLQALKLWWKKCPVYTHPSKIT